MAVSAMKQPVSSFVHLDSVEPGIGSTDDQEAVVAKDTLVPCIVWSAQLLEIEGACKTSPSFVFFLLKGTFTSAILCVASQIL